MLFLYLFTFALETELHVTHLPSIEGFLKALVIAHNSVFFVSYYPSLSKSSIYRLATLDCPTLLLPLLTSLPTDLLWYNTIGCCKLSVLREFQKFQSILKYLDPNKKNTFSLDPLYKMKWPSKSFQTNCQLKTVQHFPSTYSHCPGSDQPRV